MGVFEGLMVLTVLAGPSKPHTACGALRGSRPTTMPNPILPDADSPCPPPRPYLYGVIVAEPLRAFPCGSLLSWFAYNSHLSHGVFASVQF